MINQCIHIIIKIKKLNTEKSLKSFIRKLLIVIIYFNREPIFDPFQVLRTAEDRYTDVIFFLHVQSAESCRKASESSTRSVTAEADTSSRRTATKVKREPATTTTNATTTTAPPTHPQGLSPSDDLKDEPGDFIETNCHWRDCGLEFPTQVI